MGENNAVGPAAIASATAPLATALQRQASGLVNAVAGGLPERGEPAAPLLPDFNSYAAGVREQPELFAVRSSRRVKMAKLFNRSARFGCNPIGLWGKSGMPCCFSKPPPRQC